MILFSDPNDGEGYHLILEYSGGIPYWNRIEHARRGSIYILQATYKLTMTCSMFHGPDMSRQ
jgi:hypothetical protein